MATFECSVSWLSDINVSPICSPKLDMGRIMKHDQKNDQLLTSWKEIAAHLGKGVRTAQRWEREIGLPVRRPAENRHIVVALAADLDNWIAHLAHPSRRSVVRAVRSYKARDERLSICACRLPPWRRK